MIHQAKSNPQLLDEQIFSERLASAISVIGRFSDAGIPRPSSRSESRRPKSAKAGKSRDVWAPTCSGRYGDLTHGVSVGEVEPNAGDRIALAGILGGRAGANKRIARCSTGFSVR